MIYDGSLLFNIVLISGELTCVNKYLFLNYNNDGVIFKIRGNDNMVLK